MNLSDFVNLLFTDRDPNIIETVVYVFLSDDDRDGYRYENESAEFFAVTSHMKLQHFLLNQFASAKVTNFYAYGKNVLDVIIDVDSPESYECRRAYIQGYRDCKKGIPSKYE